MWENLKKNWLSWRWQCPHRFGAYLSFHFDQEHTDSLGCQFNGKSCDVHTDEVTVLNLALAALTSVRMVSYRSSFY